MDLDDEELKATRRMNGSDKNVACIEKDIKILEEFIEDSKDYIHYSITGDELGALEHLIKAYKELEEENIQLEACKDDVIRRYNFESIPVSLVEETIGELNKAYEDSKDENGESEYYYPDYTIRVLEELLEKRK